MVAGSTYGTELVWAVVAGVLVKLVFSEGMGRYFLATGHTLVEGWSRLARPALWYFIVYFVIATFIFGAAAPAVSGMTMHSMAGAVSVTGWTIIHALGALLLLLFGRYRLFERLMELLVALMFITIVTLAVLLVRDPVRLIADMAPSLGGGNLLYTLGLIGGVGGTFSMVFYPYWIGAKEWSGPRFLGTMRIDIWTGYLIIGIFCVAMMIVGASILFNKGLQFDDDFLSVAEPLGDQFGSAAKWLFLLGAWSAATSTLLGALNGAGYVCADVVRILRGAHGDQRSQYLTEKSRWFRGYLVFMVIPPMVLLPLGQPVVLVLVYTALGSVFLPFLGVTLLIMLNRRDLPRELRNGFINNVAMTMSVGLFAVLGIVAVSSLT
jgi:Mn2+/Fe2+ NRAMP family transporter